MRGKITNHAEADKKKRDWFRETRVKIVVNPTTFLLTTQKYGKQFDSSLSDNFQHANIILFGQFLVPSTLLTLKRKF